MPSRRILSNSTLAPIQKNAVNPFDSFNSDTVNLLTRIVSGGSDVIVKGLDVISTKVTNYTNTTNLIKPFSTEQEFQNGWISKNVLWNANGLNFILPNGETYGLSYVECKLLTENYEYLFSGNGDAVRDFNISFELVHGTPKSIVVCINESNFVIDHPVGSIDDNIGTRYEIKISRNLINDNIQKGLVFRLGVVFDTADPYTYSTPVVTNENSDYKTFSIIKNVFCNLVEESSSSIHNIIQSNEGIYADSGIHMTNTLKVTPGIAIKDDVMLQTFAKTYLDKNATVTLKVDDDYSWIKGKAYSKNDFSGPQYAYQMNGIDSSESVKKICFFDVNGYLKVRLDNSVNTKLIDDYEFNPEIDTLLNLDEYSGEKDNSGNYIFRSSSKQNVGKFGGRNVLFVYNDDDGKDYVIGRIQVSIIQDEIDPFYVSLNPSLLPISFNQKVDDGTVSQHLKAYLTAGPIKISGDPRKYNKECVKWAYVVLYYAYFKNPKPNISYIGLIDEKDLKDLKYREDYLILAKLRFIDCHTVDIISYDERQINNLPDASLINYRDTCQYPEIWKGDIPGSVTDAINAVVQKLDENSNTVNLKHNVYKEVDSSYRISKLNSDYGVQKTPIVTINDNNHLERKIRSDSSSCVITNINDYSEIIGNINVGDIFTLDSKLKLYLNDTKTWAFDSRFKSFGPYDSDIDSFTKKYVCFNEIPPYQFVNKINGNKVISVDFKYDDYSYLYPTAPSLKKRNDVFVDTDDGTKLDNYILSYNPLTNLVSTDIFKDIVFGNINSSDTLSGILKMLGATVNGNISNSPASKILNQYAFTVGTFEQDNIAIEKLGSLFGGYLNSKRADNAISDILSDYAFDLPKNNEILLELLIVKLGGQYTFTTSEDKYNYLNILANVSIDKSAYSVFDKLSEISEKIHIVKDIVLKFGGYITEKDSNDVYITHRGTQIISNILSDITYNVSNNPDEVINVIIERVSHWYQKIDQHKLSSDMNSEKNHFSYLKYNGELLTGKKLIHELEKNAINPGSVTADNIVSFGNSDGKLSDSNIQASTIITRTNNIDDSQEGYIPEFLPVDTTNNTRVIASSGISTNQIKNIVEKLKIDATTKNNLVTFADDKGKLKDSGMAIKEIPFCENDAIDNQLIKFGNQNSYGQKKLSNSSISENKLEFQLAKIPTKSTKNNVAIFSDTDGTIVDSFISIKDFMYQPDFIHKTINEGFDGDPSMETINSDLIGDKGWSGRHYFKNTINGVAFSSKWADLAEYYKVPAGITYPVGTLVKFGNKYYNDDNIEITDINAEIVICNAGDECNAVISSTGNDGTAALILNNKESSGSQLIALSGRVKIRVRGTIKKFEYLTLSNTYKGVAVAVSNNNTQKVIARALEAHNPSDPNEEGLILCVSTFSLTGNKQNHKPNKNITANDIAIFEDENGSIANSGISKQSIILRKRSGEVDSVEPNDGYDTTKNYIPEFAEVNSDGNRLIKNSGIETDKLIKMINSIPESTNVNNIAIFENSDGKIKDSGINISNIAYVSNSNNIQEDTIVKFDGTSSNGSRNVSAVKYKNADLTENVLSELISKIPQQQTTPGALVIFDDVNGKLGDSHILFNDIDLNRKNMITRSTNEGFNGDPAIDNINSDPVTGGLTGDKGWAGNHYFKNTINGTVLKTQYGDLAEWYTTDLLEGSEYALGTLIKFGGVNEITIASDGEVNGVISNTSQAGLQMGVNYKTNTSQLVALEGKVKIRVIGSVNKFDYLTLSSIPGIAIATNDCQNKKIIARALETNDDIREKMIVCVTKFDL